MSSSAPPAPASAPIVVRFGSLGDLVQLTVLLESAAARWGQPVRVVTALRGVDELYRGLDCFAASHLVRSRRRPYLLDRSQRGLVRWLRDQSDPPTYLVETVPARVAKVRRLLARGAVAAHRIVDASALARGPLEHTVDFLRRVALADAGGVPATPPEVPRLAVLPAELDAARRWAAERGWLGRPWIVVHPFSRRANRGRWPLERWVEALRALRLRQPEAVLLISGSAAEGPSAQELARAVGDPALHDVSGELPLRRLVATLALARACLSLDSGPAHVAAAVGCPVVVLAGMADPRRVAPRSAGSSVEIAAAIPRAEWPDSPHEWARRNRLAEIAVAEVLAAWERLRPREGFAA